MCYKMKYLCWDKYSFMKPIYSIKGFPVAFDLVGFDFDIHPQIKKAVIIYSLKIKTSLIHPDFALYLYTVSAYLMGGYVIILQSELSSLYLCNWILL